MAQKRPFMTAKGYLGMATPSMVQGDRVVILCGGRIPYILRLSGNKNGREYYTLVGEAYYYGVMDGEIVTKEEKRDFFLV